MPLSQKSAPETILLKGFDQAIFHEAVAAVAITPGELVEVNSSSQFALAGTGTTLVTIAREDDIQGKAITDAYSANNNALAFCPGRGSEVYLTVTDGSAAIAIGADVEFDASGLVKLADGTQVVIGQAMTAVDASDSAVTSLANRRIKVRIR